MRKLIVNCVAFGIVGGILAGNGINVGNISFWAIMICMGFVQFNEAIND